MVRTTAFVTDRKRQRKQPQANKNGKSKSAGEGPPESAQVPLEALEALVRACRERYAKALASVPALRERAASLRTRAAQLSGSRLTIRFAAELRRKADAYEREAGRIEGRTEERAFEQKASQYIEIARWNVEQEAAANKRPKTAEPLSERFAAVLVRRRGPSAKQPHPADQAKATTSTPGQDEDYRQSNAMLVKEFLAEFEGQAPPMKITQQDLCPTADCGAPLLLSVNGSMLMCPRCKFGFPYMDATTASMSYGDEVEFSSFTYKKAHHFEDWLKKFQAKGSKRVATEILEKVMVWHVQRGYTNGSDITRQSIRKALKAHNLKEYYDHDMQIFCRVTGTPPPNMSAEEEQICRLMFLAIQAPYIKWKNILAPDRVNFLSYSYVLYKICQLCGWTRYLEYFSLLKGRDKLQKQELIWKGICTDMDWDFIPADTNHGAASRNKRKSPTAAAPPRARPAERSQAMTCAITAKRQRRQ